MRCVHGELGAAPGAELVDGAAFLHVSAHHDADPVAQPLDQVELVAGEDDGYTVGRFLGEHVAHHVDGDRVEPGEGLVQHQHVGVVHQCGDQLYPLLVAEAQRVDGVVRPGVDAQTGGPCGDGVGRITSGQPVQLRQVGQLWADLHLRVEPAFLRHVTDAPAQGKVDRLATQMYVPGVGGQDAERNPHRRRLAGAIATHKAEELAGLNLKTHVLQGDGVAVALVEPLDLQLLTTCGRHAPSPECGVRSASTLGAGQIRHRAGAHPAALALEWCCDRRRPHVTVRDG